MANIDQNYDGSTRLRNWYPKVKSNFSAINTQVDEIATNAALIQNSDGGFSAGNNADAETGGAVGASAGTMLGGSVGNNAHSSAGGAVGYAAIATTGGAVGQGAHSEDGGAMGYWAQAKSGGAIGADAAADTGGAVGRKAWTGDGGAAGYLAYAANGGGSVGKNANSDAGGAVGANAKAGAGFAGGSGAKAVNSSNNGIDAIQLGTGTNNTPKTLQVYGHQLLDASGKIPDARLNDAPSDDGVYARKNGVWKSIFNNINQIIEPTYDPETLKENTDLDHLPQGITIVTYIDEPTMGGYMVLTPDKIDSTTAYSYQFRFGYGGVQRRLYYAGAWDDWQEVGISDAPNDGNTYARKDGTWEKLTAGQYYNQQLVNFKYASANSYMEEITDLDHLPNGLTVVPWADGPGLGGYFVLTALELNESSSKTGYQIKIDHTGMSQRMCSYGTWGTWSKIG